LDEQTEPEIASPDRIVENHSLSFFCAHNEMVVVEIENEMDLLLLLLLSSQRLLKLITIPLINPMLTQHLQL
jgi:hypothetical protein